MKKAHRVETGPTHIKDLISDPANRRAHNPRNLGMVSDALREVGAARSIVIDEDDVILAGNDNSCPHWFRWTAVLCQKLRVKRQRWLR